MVVGACKSPGYSGVRGGCSEPRSCHCTPAWATKSETPSQKKKIRRKHPKQPISRGPAGPFSSGYCVWKKAQNH
uniref:Uncharacterized protein n=1 Tax=Astyanax mexicanus TaxID=7994 RepID=A0A3B1JI88_ASTMX